MKSFNFVIEYQCPQCGAPATLSETDRLFTCEFCRVKSYLMPGRCFRYLLPSGIPDNRQPVYFPYWRFKGMLFSCVPDGVRPKFFDISRQAVDTDILPHSLGFRSQALKLRFATPETAGTFVPPALTLEEIIQAFDDRIVTQLPKPVYHNAHIGENLSLIYAPFYVDQKLYDGVLNEPVDRRLTEDFADLYNSGEAMQWRMSFLPTLCPKCGWDLEGERESLVLLCRNCQSAWQPGKRKLHQVRYGNVETDEEDVLFLPFWRIRAEVSGVALASYADLVRAANLPKVVKAEWHEIPFRFWCPAFKIRPQTFLPLASKMTLSQPREIIAPELPRGDLHPVTLPVQEAVQSLKVILANFIKPRTDFFPRLGEIGLDHRSYLLVYIPFSRHHHEFTQPLFRLTILKSQLSHAQSL